MTSTPISDELKQVLLQWDDTDDATRAVSLSRLESLCAHPLAELAAATRYVEQRYRTGYGVILGTMTVSYSAMIGFALSLPRQPNPPMPPWFPWAMLGCMIIFFAGLAAGSKLLPTKLAAGLSHALACYPPSQSVSLLLRLTPASTYKNNSSHDTQQLVAARYKVLVKALNQVSTTDMPVLTPKERRRLRGMVSFGNSDVASAALHALTVLEDASILPRVRKIAERTRNWELQETANDYLRRFAPDEVTTRHRIEVEPSRHADAAPANIAPILACVMRLGSRDTGERQAAEKTLRTMPPEDLKQILLLLDQEPPADKFISRAIVLVCSTGGALLGSLVYFWALRWPYFDAQMASTVALAGAFAGGGVAYIKGLNINYKRRNWRRARLLGSTGGIFPEKRLLDVLAALEEVALIGTILDHIPPPTAIMVETMRGTLRASLQNLLPRLRASDANLLTEPHRNWLNHELQRSAFKLSEGWAGKQVAERQANFDIAILKAWEQVGDERALTFVQQLATMTAKSPAKKRVREAAEQCLPYLEARVGEQRQTQTLLRASTVPTEAGDILLRAATAQTAPVESEQLLRAGIRNNEE